eukprot:4086772-Amphidinium_carterae.1
MKLERWPRPLSIRKVGSPKWADVYQQKAYDAIFEDESLMKMPCLQMYLPHNRRSWIARWSPCLGQAPKPQAAFHDP